MTHFNGKCSDCRYCIGTLEPKCKRFPPQRTIAYRKDSPGLIYSDFPEVLPDDYCYEFKFKDPVEPSAQDKKEEKDDEV